MASSLTQLLNTARDGLTAQSFGLGVTGQNISNVNTPGYVRRTATLETNATDGGVTATGLQRVTDAFIERRQYESTGLSSAASEHDQDLASVEALFNDQTGTGLASSLSALFQSFSSLAANPGDSTTRQGVLQAADNFSQRVRDTADTLAKSRDDLLQEAQGTVNQVNDNARAIAKLNAQISAAEAQGQDAADLKDQRNKVLLDLASLVDVRAIASGNSIAVQVSGTTLVDGGTANQLGVNLDGSGNLQILASDGSGAGSDVTKFLTGGKLAGIRETRDVDILATSQKLDQFVFDVGSAINAQHEKGFGQDGVSGRDIFAVSTIPAGAARTFSVSNDVLGNPAAIAAAGASTALPGDSDNAAALSALSTATIATGGTRTAADAYGDVVGDVATRKSASAKMVETRKAIGAQIDAMQQSMSGVSLDEEFVNLTKYQKAYEASTRVLTTADQLLQDLIDKL